MTLGFDPDTLELPIYHFIGGERVDEAGTLEMRRPSDGKRNGACPVVDETDVDCAVQTAKHARRG
jgi:aldehyde dehydrogenase (NAD+)